MRLHPEDIADAGRKHGIPPGHVETSARILEVLGQMATDPLLRSSLALKGGAAIHLFELDLPRVSIDIDLDLVAPETGASDAADLDATLRVLRSRCDAAGVWFDGEPRRFPALVQWAGKFRNSQGRRQPLKIEIQRQHRVVLEPVRFREPRVLATVGARGVPVVGRHQLIAGKLVALLDRGRPRDLFDAPALLGLPGLDINRVRLLTVVMSAGTRTLDLRRVTPDSVHYDEAAIRSELAPFVGAAHGPRSGERPKEWASRVYGTAIEAVRRVLPIDAPHRAFLDALLDEGAVRPELLTSDADLQDRIGRHPAVLWRALCVRRHRGGG